MPSPSPLTPAAEPPRPRGRPRKTAEERDDGNRRQALLGAAALLFRQHGLAATSTRDTMLYAAITSTSSNACLGSGSAARTVLGK